MTDPLDPDDSMEALIGQLVPAAGGPLGSEPDDDPVDAAGLLAKHPDLAELFGEVMRNATAAQAEATRKVYRRDWMAFEAWCVARGVAPLPALPVVVAMYISEGAKGGAAVASLARRLASIAAAHRRHGHPSPAGDPHVRDVWKGLRRRYGRPQGSRMALLTETLRLLVDAAPSGPMGLTRQRDRALLLVGWAGAFRRSELVALTVEDIEPSANGGLRVTVRRSKTDQEGRGLIKMIGRARDPRYCPVEALDAWRRAAGIATGPLFRAVNRHGHIRGRALTGASVALVVKRAARAAGVEGTRLSGHSLRSGFATSMSAAGANLQEIMEQTGHRSTQQAMRYVQEAGRLRANVTQRAGL